MTAKSAISADSAAPRRAASPVAILGAGPIGLACALMLAQRGVPSQVIDARTLEQARGDRRLLALSHGTLQMLNGLLGGRLAPLAPIDVVHVSSAGEFGAARLTKRDFGGLELGATAWYADLIEALSRAAAREPRISLRRPLRVVGLEQRPGSVRVVLQSGEIIDTPLAINAEGAPPAPAAGTPTSQAILATLRVRGLAPGTAVERFTREGPLALLPMPGDGAQGSPDPVQQRSLIWCLDSATAAQRLALDEPEFVDRVQAGLGTRIARVLGAGPRIPFTLLQQRRSRLREHRLVYIGNAAQSLHPVAGQGFNLGMRDCACLAESLAGAPDDVMAALDGYCAARRSDRWAITGFTGWLPGAFAARSAALASARSGALLAVDLVPPLRRGLSRLLMFGLRH
jgi:2-octaprenyl-6-methoxyphenol hydroxylase